jgi:hypothetical protein
MKTPNSIDKVVGALARAHQRQPVSSPTPGWQKRVMAGIRSIPVQPADEASSVFLHAAWASTALAFCLVMIVVLADWHQPTDSLAWLWLQDAASTQTFLMNL